MKRTPMKRKTPLRAMSKKHAERLRTVTKELKSGLVVKSIKRKRPKTTPLRQAAKGQPCFLNVAGVCVYDSARVSLAHFRWLGECGVGLKPSDLQGSPACDACNHWTDSPTPRQIEDCGGRVAYERDRNYYAARALVRLRLADALDAF